MISLITGAAGERGDKDSTAPAAATAVAIARAKGEEKVIFLGGNGENWGVTT
jgi:hypothetical protein